MKIINIIKVLRTFPYILDALRCKRKCNPPASIPVLLLWLTNRCNLKCIMCDHWKTGSHQITEELSTEQWISIIDSAKRMHTSVISLTGGEPFLRPDIFKIVEYIRKQGISCHICTNGTLLNEDAVEKLSDVQPTSVSVSLDSVNADIHNYMRGRDCFDTVIEAITLLRKKAPAIKLGINIVVTRQNFRRLDKMGSFAKGLGIDRIKFAPVCTNLMHKRKKRDDFKDLLFNIQTYREMDNEIKKVLDSFSNSAILGAPITFYKKFSCLYNERYKKLKCYAGFLLCSIDPFGYVSPCRDIDSSENIKNSSLEEIWKSDLFGRSRKEVHECRSMCWDSTNTKVNIYFSPLYFIKEIPQGIKDIMFYLD